MLIFFSYQGLHITRDSDDGVCYVIAVGASNASEIHDFERLIQENDGSEMAVHDRNQDGQEAIAQILPGEIEDTSFIPQGAHKECTSGYKWMSFISKGRTMVLPDIMILELNLMILFAKFGRIFVLLL